MNFKDLSLVDVTLGLVIGVILVVLWVWLSITHGQAFEIVY